MPFGDRVGVLRGEGGAVADGGAAEDLAEQPGGGVADPGELAVLAGDPGLEEIGQTSSSRMCSRSGAPRMMVTSGRAPLEYHSCSRLSTSKSHF